MKYQILDLIQGTPEWLAARREKVTASQVPILMGMSPYQKANQLLLEKFTGVEQEVSDFKQVLFARGHEAEAAARDWVKEHMGLVMEPAVLLSQENPELLASLDGFSAPDLIFEAKYMGSKSLAEVAEGRIKPYHDMQIQAQLRVSGAKKCLYFAMDQDGNAQIAEINPNPKVFKAIDRAVNAFSKDLARLRAKQKSFLDFQAKLEAKYTPARKKRAVKS